MGRWVKIPRIKGVDIPWVGGQNAMGWGSNTMGRGVDISWVYFFLCVW